MSDIIIHHSDDRKNQVALLVENGKAWLTQNQFDCFDKLLKQIQDIRASELRFYQKVRELFLLSSDYQPDDKATQMFFALTQKTATKLICQRADSTSEQQLTKKAKK